MKAKDIKTYEVGSHCFGPILSINEVNYGDIDKKEVVEFINEMIEKDMNSELLLQELFEITLGYLQGEVIEDEHYTCDSCGDFNYYTKYKI